MEERQAKVSFNKSGGTAKGTAITNRVKLILDNDKIIIEKIK